MRRSVERSGSRPMHLNGETVALGANASLLYCDQYLQPQEAESLLDFCLSNIQWEQSEILMFGKRVTIPRLNAWYGDHEYKYSGTTFEARKPPAPLERIQQQLMQDTALTFNSVLANLYRDGDDCMGWHSDDEKSLGINPQIASISLGAVRRFSIRNKKEHTKKHSLELGSGSLLLMLGDCQGHWQHTLPRMRKVTEHRINLTFRNSQPI